jgi:hypothetical protein
MLVLKSRAQEFITTQPISNDSANILLQAYSSTGNSYEVWPGYNGSWYATDSVKWLFDGVDSLNEGDPLCSHVWEIKELPGSNMSCLVMHPPGQHCSWNDVRREKICKICLRHEYEREHWYQHQGIEPESEFDKLKKQLNKKE